jgi:hypothetical protein
VQKFKFSVWAPVYSDVEVEANDYSDALTKAAQEAKKLRNSDFEFVIDPYDIEVLPENLNEEAD